jgi:primary-amine oxidase
MLDASSGVLRRVSAVDHALWVTAYDAEERYPCGEFLVASERDTGLPLWTAKDRPLEDADVVLWHVFGLFHEPRTEDWPVMPTESTSFALKPAGFFDRNPALDVPREPGHCGPGH